MLSALAGRTVPRESIGEPLRAEMLALMQLCYADVSRERFERDLNEKQFVILLYSSRTGELAGFSTLRVADEPVDGVTAEIVFSGDTVIHPDYWGQKELQRQFSRFLLSRKLRRPTRPLHWLLLSAGYKTYLLTVNYFPRTHPRCDWATPERRVRSLDALATRWFGAQYEPSSGTLTFADAHYYVREGVAPIDRAAASHPHIGFFAERNPRHAEGAELVCLAEVRLRDLLRAVVRIAHGQVRSWMRRSLRVLGVDART